MRDFLREAIPCWLSVAAVTALLVLVTGCDGYEPGGVEPAAPAALPSGGATVPVLDTCNLATGQYRVEVTRVSDSTLVCPALDPYTAITPSGDAAFVLPATVDRSNVQRLPACVIESSSADGTWFCWLDPTHRDGGCSYGAAGNPCLYELHF